MIRGLDVSQAHPDRRRGCISVEKRIARHPCAHKEGHYRCFLPDLTEFVILYCPGPGYHTDDHVVMEERRLRWVGMFRQMFPDTC